MKLTLNPEFVSQNIKHFPDKNDLRCNYCGLMKQTWTKEPYCMARTSHKISLYASIDGNEDDEPCCARCGMYVSQWGTFPKCPVAERNQIFDTILF